MKTHSPYFIVAATLMALASARLANGQGELYFVNTTSDTVVVGACQNGNAGCSLRGAIQRANAHAGVDGISIELPAGSVINLTQALPDITEGVGITGPGADKLIVRRNTGGNYRIFTVTTTGTVGFAGMTISNGNTSGDGGGIQNSSTGTVNVTNCVLSGNNAGNGGGGIDNNGTLTVTNSTLSNHEASFGGAISNSGTLNVINSTLSDNDAFSESGAGGGIFNFNTGIVNVTNSTLSNNAASGNINPGSTGRGGGISNNGTLNLTNCTISANGAQTGGGVDSNGGTVKIKSSIIALNTANVVPDLSGTFTSQSFNLIGKNDGAAASFPAGNPNANNDIVGTSASPIDPKLDPNGLQNNGGPTLTIALLVGSPALDKGSGNGLTGQLTTDQRGSGFPRTNDSSSLPNASGGDGTDIGAVESTDAVPTPTPTPTPTPSPTPGLVGNVATRLPVGTDDNVLIEGFIVLGPNGSAKKIMVRALGPFLIPFGIPDALANPTLEIRDGTNALIATNNDWRNTQVGGIITGDQSAEIEGSGLAPVDDVESAIIANLAPGNYTAVVRGVSNTVGTGIVDAFDMSPASPARLANVATRGLIQPGDQLMIAGFIIQQGDVRAVVRAIGPSLSAFGITNALPDTTLQLRDVNGAIVRENDDWQSDPTQKQEIEDTGLQPSNPLEAAIVATIPPGQYTVQVRGKPETTGIGVVEIYFLQ